MPRKKGTTKVTLSRNVPSTQAEAVKRNARAMGWKVKSSKRKRRRRDSYDFF